MKNFKIAAIIGLALAMSACSSNKSGDATLIKSGTLSDTSKVAYLGKHVGVGADGKLVLGAADFNGSSTGQSGYDAGMNALKNGLSVNPAFGAVKGYSSGSTGIYLRDPATAGWEYQTFGQVINENDQTSQGFINVGRAYTPADTATINATYDGIAMGVYGGNSEVIANMEAQLAWGASAKTLTVDISDSKIALNNMTNRYSGLTDASVLDFTETLNWDGSKFASSHAQAHLYGEAKEMGGTFNHTVNGESYQGAFAGKKQ